MDDDQDESSMQWMKKPKNSFQTELQAKLRQRKYEGKSVDISDSDESDLSNILGIGQTKHSSEYRRRRRENSDLSHGLGTQTMRTKDLSKMLKNSLSDDDDDDDDEIIAANFGKSTYGKNLEAVGSKIPSPKQESQYLRKTTRTFSSENVNAFGRKTPIKETSLELSLSQDSKFGRSTPTIAVKENRSVTLHENEHGDKQWQPPKYRSISPKEKEQSIGSRGISPLDSSLERISENLEEKMNKQILRGLQEETDPLSRSQNKPKPQTRGKVSDRKSSPNVEQQRKSPSSPNKIDSVKRRTPTLDIFGQSRSAAVQELEEYMENNSDKETKDRKSSISRSQTPERKQSGSLHKTPEKSTVKFAIDDKEPRIGKKPPFESLERKSPQGKKSSEKDMSSSVKESLLLDFLMEDTIAAKPKPQARRRLSKGMGSTDILDDIFGNAPKMTSKEERKSPGITGRKTPEHVRKSPVSRDKQDNIFQTIADLTEETSSVCEDIPPDPNRKVTSQESTNQTTERAQADNAIETVAVAQTLKHSTPAKRMRPRTASAKVQHRPRPRHNNQLNKTSDSSEKHHYSSTGDIREAIYEEWYKEHLHSARQRKKDEQKKAKDEEEKKKKEAEEKHHEAELSYTAWMKQKLRKFQQEYNEKEKKEKLIQEQIEKEKKEQKARSLKLFETWKAKKDSTIKKELEKKSEETKRAEKEKKQKLLEKERERKSAHNSWLKKKEQQQIIQIKQKQLEDKKKSNHEEQAKQEFKNKEQNADKSYNEWLEEKENQARLEKVKATRKLEDEESRPAWSPASRTIPFGR